MREACFWMLLTAALCLPVCCFAGSEWRGPLAEVGYATGVDYYFDEDVDGNELTIIGDSDCTLTFIKFHSDGLAEFAWEWQYDSNYMERSPQIYVSAILTGSTETTSERVYAIGDVVADTSKSGSVTGTFFLDSPVENPDCWILYGVNRKDARKLLTFEPRHSHYAIGIDVAMKEMEFVNLPRGKCRFFIELDSSMLPDLSRGVGYLVTFFGEDGWSVGFYEGEADSQYWTSQFGEAEVTDTVNYIRVHHAGCPGG